MLTDSGWEGSETPMELAWLFITIIVTFILIYWSFTSANGKALEFNDAVFRDGLKNATVAYSRQYDLQYKGLANIAEGYLLKEDLEKYKVYTNPVSLDIPKATKFFYKCFQGTTGITPTEARSYNLNMFIITTLYDNVGNTKFVLNTYKQCDLSQGTRTYTTMDEIQTYIQQTYLVTIDITTGYNTSLKKAQVYEKAHTTRADGQNVYSSYNTYMVIGKNVPIKTLFGNQHVDIAELQTYSIER